MSGFFLFLGLGRALELGAPSREPVWRSLCASFRTEKLPCPPFAHTSADDFIKSFYRAWVQEKLGVDAITAAQEALMLSTDQWAEFISCLSSKDTPVRDRMGHVLQLKTAISEKLPEQLAHDFFTSLESIHSDMATSPVPALSHLPRPVTVAPSESFLTQSQAVAVERVIAMSELYFNQTPSAGLRPRYSPLLIGPTGSGKTEIVSRVAKRTNAHLLRVAVSDWIPIGSRETVPTLRTIIDTLMEHDRVALFIDELDKLTDSSSAWSRSCLSEIYDVLERTIPLHLAKGQIEADQLQSRIQNNLWLCGAGTWQHLQNIGSTTPSLGFGHRLQRTPDIDSDSASLVRNALKEGFPAELLGRFHNSAIMLNYPSRSETLHILENLGLTAMAQRLGRADLIETFDWHPFGLRKLESLLADLAIISRSHVVKAWQERIEPSVIDRS
jgi:ATPase family associated with various cellular activities (AAA)